MNSNYDSQEVIRALSLWWEPGCVYELRCPKTTNRNGVVSGFFDDPKELAKSACYWSGNAEAVYVTLNPITPTLLPRRHNDVKVWCEKGDTVKDEQIVRLTRLLVDCDAIRPDPYISSTDEEHEDALATAREVREFLSGHGFPAPILASSGNGGHLQYRIDLPVEDAVILENLLKALKAKWPAVDVTTFNAARVCKLYGTLVMKGSDFKGNDKLNLPARPHRIARLIESPDALDVVPADRLRAVAGMSSSSSSVPSSASQKTVQSVTMAAKATGDDRLSDWLDETFGVLRQGEDGDGWKWNLERCPWADSHTTGPGDSAIWRNANGTHGFKCFHSHCSGRTFNDVRVAYPDIPLLSEEKEELFAALDAVVIAKKDTSSAVSSSDEVDTSSGEEGGKKGRIADVLVKLAKSNCELWHTPDHVAYVTLPTGSNVRVKSEAFKLWLGRMLHKVTGGRVIGRTPLDDALNMLTALAIYEGKMHPVYYRYARLSDRLEIDLGDDTHAAVIITKDGWDIGKPSVKFRRPNNMGALPRPIRGGSIDRLREFLNVDDAGFTLLVGSIVDAIKGKGGYLVTALSGEQGCAKTTAALVMSALIDPLKLAKVFDFPTDNDALAVMAHNRYMLAFDNVGRMTSPMSNSLCRVSTGGGLTKRALYTDDDEKVYDVTRPVVVTGIEDVAEKSDMLNRIVPVLLYVIPEDKRMTEEALWAKFSEAQPVILGALYDAIAHALAHPVTLAKLPRMADSAVWIASCSGAFGWEPTKWLDIFSSLDAKKADIAIDASVVASAVRAWWERDHVKFANGIWEGTVAELMPLLYEFVPHRLEKYWPTGGSQLANKIRREMPSLRTIGIDIVVRRTKYGAVYTVRSIPTPDAIADPKVYTNTPVGDATGDGDAAVTLLKSDRRHPLSTENTRVYGNGDAGDAAFLPSVFSKKEEHTQGEGCVETQEGRKQRHQRHPAEEIDANPLETYTCGGDAGTNEQRHRSVTLVPQRHPMSTIKIRVLEKFPQLTPCDPPDDTDHGLRGRVVRRRVGAGWTGRHLIGIRDREDVPFQYLACDDIDIACEVAETAMSMTLP